MLQYRHTHQVYKFPHGREALYLIPTLNRSKGLKLLEDENSHGPCLHQGTLQNETAHFPSNFHLESPSFRNRFRPNVLPLPEQASGVGLGIAQ